MPVKEKFSEDWPLLQVHRQYSQDEAMKLLFNEISQLKFQIGELKSENTELSYELKKLKDSPAKVETIIVRSTEIDPDLKTAKQWKKEKFVEEIHKQVKALEEKNKKLEKELNDLRYAHVKLREKQTIVDHE